MASIEQVVEAPFTDADLDGAQDLVVQAGWNQTPGDRRIFLELGRMFGVRAPDRTLIGTAAVLPYAGGFGWISMVLVAREWRRRGIGTRLLNRCIEALRETNASPMLDATPDGRDVYRRIGFRDQWPITRWRRTEATTSGCELPNLRRLGDRDWNALVALDAAAFGCNREKLLERLRVRSRDFACVAETNGKLSGFLLGRDGRTARHLGPLVAEDAHTAAALVNFAAQQIRQPVLLDALDRHDAFGGWLEEHGFVKERPLMRMTLGSEESAGDPRKLIAIAGPELG
jgi:GNAT superfamily N-acetyltransferase